MNQVTIILVHTGSGQIPSHVHESLSINKKVAKKSRIVFLASEKNLKSFFQNSNNIDCNDDLGIHFVPIESFPESNISKQFRENSKLDRSFREGFWFNASNRFFVLSDYISYAGIENVLHLENDYVLYFDPTDKLKAFSEYAEFSVPLDRVRAIPGIVWLQNANVGSHLIKHISENPYQDDMTTLGDFCISSAEIVAKPLPTLPHAYTVAKGLDLNKYSNGIEQFGGVFDAAAIGQYIGGIHWMNNPADTTFFINESSDLNLNEVSCSWGVKDGLRFPEIIFNNVTTRVLGIHAHSKFLEGFSPFNHGVQIDTGTLVTGERLQSYCDITIGAPSITRFHGKENIRSKDLLELPEDSQGNLAPPTIELIERISQAKSIFIYTHLIPYFKYYLAPRMKSSFTLVTHNSDHPVTVVDFQLLNHPLLKNWFAQNCEFNHVKLRPLPIGLQNNQWGPEKLKKLVDSGKCITKTEILYANFTVHTHSSRADAMAAIKDLKNITIESNVSYEQYLKNLAKHKFCLCPRGNGIDTHRFWEAQYLDCIPVILWCDWTSAYSELPILILGSWDELRELDLNKIYIAISNKKYSRASLSLQNLVKQIRHE